MLHPEHIQAENVRVIVSVRPCRIIDHRGDSRPDKIITSECLAGQPLPVTAEVVTPLAPYVDQFLPADVVYWGTRKLDVLNRCFEFQHSNALAGIYIMRLSSWSAAESLILKGVSFMTKQPDSTEARLAPFLWIPADDSSDSGSKWSSALSGLEDVLGCWWKPYFPSLARCSQLATGSVNFLCSCAFFFFFFINFHMPFYLLCIPHTHKSK